ncbi:MAG: T9SS type A sorting domain-containing protein [Saprospiraceae bacterium]|nr:T9SS type A sorting domain-containing protein [Saprospiraceae bacterium]
MYTIERNDFAVPANGAATVACPANATQPTPPTVTSDCGEAITPTGPVIGATPACEGTKTYTWTYTDCEGNSHPWSFVYTVERLPFTVPANGAATVACPAQATQPTPPVVLSNCGEVITPTGPVVANNPNPLTCEGMRTFTWTYTDCEGNSAQWGFVYTVERQPFGIPANGGATVDCPDDTDVQPTPPVVLSNCGEVLTPVLVSTTPKNGCEGNRNYTWRYTDCEGNTADWTFIYIVEYLDFSIPSSESYEVECPLNAGQPTPPTVFDNCGKLLNPTGPVIASTNNAGGCEASRSYTWAYADCEGNSHAWSTTYHFQYTADFFVYPNGEDFVGCLDYAQPPVPPTLYDNCGQEIVASGPIITEEISEEGCAGVRTFTYVYTDCGGHSHPWSFTYFANDNLPPVGNCPSGTVNNVDETGLACIQDVPCPEDYDFTGKVEEMLQAGNIYDVCSGHDLVIVLDSWTALWECSDPDGDGQHTFGRTFYFSIADQCGNEMPELCSVTYSGPCQPIAAFPQSTWGLEDETNIIDFGTIQHLLDAYGPLTVGGGNRSLTLTQAQCVADLLPGQGGPGVLAKCHQTNCAGCNPVGPQGMKNTLAANAIAMTLSLRYSVEYNGADMEGMLAQSLGCLALNPNIFFCVDGGGCFLHVFDANGVEHLYPYTIGGLLELTNYYLGGNLSLDPAPSGVYATALNEALEAVTGQYSGTQPPFACDPAAGAQPTESANKSLPTGKKPSHPGQVGFSLAPNPAGGEVIFKLSEMAAAQEVVLEIYNQLGQQVLIRKFGQVSYVNEQINLGGLGSGLYIVSVKAGGVRYEQKLVIGRN